MDKITSTSNPVVKRLRALKDAKARKETGLFLIEGEVMIREALKCGLMPTEALSETESALTNELQKAGARVFLAARSAIESAADTKTPQGVCASFRMPENNALPENAKYIIALDGVQDPGNVGTIWRTADAAGFNGILFGKGCADPYSPKVQRAAMGSGFRVAIEECVLTDALSQYKKQGYSIITSALDGSPLYERPEVSEKGFILIIGNEAKGVSEPVQAMSTMRLKIPMRGGAESLNAAIAAGILMYELTRSI